MHSLKARITLMTICVTITAVVAVTMVSVMFIINSEKHEAEQTLLLMCETGERNLDYYFNGVENSIEKVADFANTDLDSIKEDELEGHVERVREYFDTVANRTSGVLTYYYRVDPEFSKEVDGFWYTNLDGKEFTEHQVTDITQYDTYDTSQLVWFTVPKATGEPVWLPPYITDNLDVRVISYNIPIYRRGEFAGVVGIEIDYSTMAEQVESIKLYSNGYAFLTDDEGSLIYHPYIDVPSLSEDEIPDIPDGLINESTFVTYTHEGVKKKATWLTLTNGMRLTVSAPLDEIDGDWQKLVREIIMISFVIILVLCLVTWWFSSGITRPLQELTAAAMQVNQGNYDFDLEYDVDDEVGRLTATFRELAGHVREHITDLSKRVYVDALTSVRNKGAFSAYLEDLQHKMNDPSEKLEFAVCVFDCDDLKIVNDRYGHDKGDIYLKTASRLICRVFQHSPVFRIGGDEFSAVLHNDDFRNRNELIERFENEKAIINSSTDKLWEQVHITMGMSVFDPAYDRAIIDTVRRADKDMYGNKRAKKEKKTGKNQEI